VKAASSSKPNMVPTLDGVEGAKDAAHQLTVAAVFVQLEQSRFELDKNLARLFPEALLELIGIECFWQRHARSTWFLRLQ